MIAAQKMQTVRANESKVMPGKLAVHSALASWLANCCVEVFYSRFNAASRIRGANCERLTEVPEKMAICEIA